eukprot:TRINITY_DN8239_c0_g1_i1.p1 TRINITY_DN8239_c0_g1~~TRINITY_DN8239_c0_g1_i1.p1  ORF type:complete len:548 (+),score=139.42 TRINITY_DN8239_c0_g1_i1:74-1717(+)
MRAAPLLLAAAAAHAAPRTAIRAVRGQGLLQGNLLANGVAEYLNIPYAEPPVGPRRFRLAEPAGAWEGVRDATQPGPACVQRNSTLLKLHVRQSEDCLQLNIWAPANATKLPVVLWVHSDRSAQGSGLLANGSALAARGLVFVSVNYRLGALGFLASSAIADENRASGFPTTGSLNGVLDQQLALVWVADKIGDFGGDASAVTLAGGATACAHLFALQSQGLFQSAAVDSGACTWGSQRLLELDEANATSSALVAALRPQGDPSNASADLARMRSLPVSTLVSSPLFSEVGAAVDGVFLRDAPARLGVLFRRNAMVSTNTADSFCALQPAAALPGSAGDLHSALSTALGPDAGEVVQQYETAYPSGPTPSPLHVAQRYINITADACSACPSLALAQRVLSSAPAAAPPVYFCELGFNEVPGWQGMTPPDGELPYIFGQPQKWDSRAAPINAEGAAPAWDAAVKGLADTVSTSWVSFAATGTPNSPATGPWPALSGATDDTTFTSLGWNHRPSEPFRAGQCGWWGRYRARGGSEAARVDALCGQCRPG